MTESGVFWVTFSTAFFFFLTINTCLPKNTRTSLLIELIWRSSKSLSYLVSQTFSAVLVPYIDQAEFVTWAGKKKKAKRKYGKCKPSYSWL